MIILYEFLLALYMILYFPILLLKGKFHGSFLQRFGFFSDVLKERVRHPRNIWIHAVSVGEVIAIIGLMRELKIAHPDHQLILTVSTKAGHELALKRAKDFAVILWAPLDFYFIVRSFIRLIQPRAYIVAETELWPSLFTQLFRRKIPILLINGRISDNSYGKYLKIRWFIKRYLGYISVLCMQSKQDVERIIAIGAPAEKVCNIGNVKFDDLPTSNSFTLEDFGLRNDDILWVCGSTHPGEEEILLDIYTKYKDQYPSLRLAIAPRHIERVVTIEKIIQAKGLSHVRFSQMSTGARDYRAIVLVDTIGHLRSFYAFSAFVFIGKSLTVKGGHNIIEPAFFEKPVIVGPYMQNFRDVLIAFKKENALIQVNSPLELEAAVGTLLEHPDKRGDLGQKAKAVIVRQQGATKRGVELVSKALTRSL